MNKPSDYYLAAYTSVAAAVAASFAVDSWLMPFAVAAEKKPD